MMMFSVLCCAFCIHGYYDELMEYVGTFHPRSIRIYPSKKKQPSPNSMDRQGEVLHVPFPTAVACHNRACNAKRFTSACRFSGVVLRSFCVMESVTDLPQLNQIIFYIPELHCFATSDTESQVVAMGQFCLMGATWEPPQSSRLVDTIYAYFTYIRITGNAMLLSESLSICYDGAPKDTLEPSESVGDFR